MSLAALIFDVDGTLAETEELHRQAFNDSFARLAVNRRWPDPVHGWRWSPDLYRLLLRTTGGKERIAAYLRESLAIDPTPHAAAIREIHREKTVAFGQLLQAGRLVARPGVKALLTTARQAGLKLAVATTTSPENVEGVCRAALGGSAPFWFDVIAAGDQVAAKKPAPDIYHLALRDLGLGPDKCVAIEDSAQGVAAAKAAGLRCVASGSLYCRDDDLSAADLVIASFTEIASPAALQVRLSRSDNYVIKASTSEGAA